MDFHYAILALKELFDMSLKPRRYPPSALSIAVTRPPLAAVPVAG
jgi:hypothetical protein